MPRLVTLQTAAKEIGVPYPELAKSAEVHGFVIQMGLRTKRFDMDKAPEFIEACRNAPKELASTKEKILGSGISKMKATCSSQRVREAAKRLKHPSKATLQQKAAQVAQLRQTG